MGKTKLYTVPPDVVTVNIKPSQNADPAEWPDARYEELIGYAETQLTEAQHALERFTAEREIVNARQATIKEAMCHAFTQDEQDRLSAKWLANYPRVVELPSIVDYWQNRVFKLEQQITRANNQVYGRRNRMARQERKAKERAEREQREAEEAELRKQITQANWTPKQKREYEARQREKATRDERHAAELQKIATAEKEAEDTRRDAQKWLNNGTE